MINQYEEEVKGLDSSFEEDDEVLSFPEGNVASARHFLAKREKLKRAEELALVESLCNMSMQEAQQVRDNILDSLSLTMPILFKSKVEYLAKLEEMIEKEAEAERLSAETIAEADIEYEFVERLEIYSLLRMRVPKTNQQHLRENTMLRVVIPI